MSTVTAPSKTEEKIYRNPQNIQLPPLDPSADTLPKNFVAKSKELGSSKIAMRKKRFGIWQEYTWDDSLYHVKYFSLGLMALGLQRGEKVCIIGENDPDSI